MRITIGIDPGLTGAIAVIADGRVEVFDMPVIASGKGGGTVKNMVDAAGLRRALEDVIYDGVERLEAVAFLERVAARPKQGSASTFSMGDTYGCIRGVLAALSVPIEIITPQTWKKHFKLGSDKEVVRSKAVQLFPSQPLGRKQDHNRAEALLIAKYGREAST